MDGRVYFDTVAGAWDEMRKSFFSEAIREQALSAAGVRAGTIAADIGAGTGFMTEGLRSHGVRVIAIDQSEEMLARMREKSAGDRGVEYRRGDAESLPVSDASVDFAFANMYLHHVEDPPAAICEMVRIMRPCGILVITDLDEHEHRFLMEEQHDRWPGFKREEVRCWMIEAGLRGVTVGCTGENCCTTSGSGSTAEVSIFIASGRKGEGTMPLERGNCR